MVNVVEDTREWFIRITLNKIDCPKRYFPGNMVWCKLTDKECSKFLCPLKIPDGSIENLHLGLAAQHLTD